MVRRCWLNLQCRGILLIWMVVGQGPIALAVGVGMGGVCLDIFVAPALAGRHRRASFRPFVRPSVRPSVNI